MMRRCWAILFGSILIAGAASVAAGPAQDQKPPQKTEAAKKPSLPPPVPFSKTEAATDTPAKETKAKDEDPTAADLATLKRAGLEGDGAALLNFFRQRTLPDSERPGLVRTIRQLGAEHYRLREEAAMRLVQAG